MTHPELIHVRLVDPDEAEIEAMVDEPHKTLRGVRKLAGLSQQELARALGIDRAHLSRIESGQSPLTRDLELRFSELIRRAVRHG